MLFDLNLLSIIASADWDTGRGGYGDGSNTGSNQRLEFDLVLGL